MKKITISLSDPVLEECQKEALKKGMTPESWIAEIVERIFLEKDILGKARTEAKRRFQRDGTH